MKPTAFELLVRFWPYSPPLSVVDRALCPTAEGDPECKFQWFKDGAELPGETRDVCVIRATSASCVGTYWCTVTNMVGSVRTNSAEVRVCVALLWECMVVKDGLSHTLAAD